MRPAFAIAGAASLAALALATPAPAATPAVTPQAQAANAAFLAYAPTPATAHGPGALCLVDTGVSADADIKPGLVSATALEEGGSGADVDPQGHGTTMAMIAGAAGNGMIGAWPQLKIVSVRATEKPSPGQEPTFEFNDYVRGIKSCLQQGTRINAVDLALSSTIPPSPDQAQNLQNAVAEADASNVAIVAAAGNAPGPPQQPGAEPGIFAVGAFTAQPDQTSTGAVGSVCSFSANEHLTFYAPGCGLSQAEPFTDKASCCGNGTSQASAFAGAVIVALMSYDPSLNYGHAEQLLVSTATDGDLNVAAAFEADGLGSIVAAGNANIPKPPLAPSSPSPSTVATPSGPGPVQVRLLRWHRGVLTIRVAPLPHGARLHVQLQFAHGTRRVISKRSTLRVHTSRPRAVELRLVVGKADGPVLTVKLKR